MSRSGRSASRPACSAAWRSCPASRSATLLRRLTFELPFVAFAVLLPIVGRGERVDVVGVSLSVSGLWAAWNILVKGTLGVAATGLLTATTPIPSILHGLERLRLPKVFVAICGFMVRYADVVTGELHRMRVARESRGHDPRWIWQARGGRVLRRRAVHPFVRTGRTRLPGDGVAWVRRRDAGAAAPSRQPRRVGAGALAPGRRGRRVDHRLAGVMWLV